MAGGEEEGRGDRRRGGREGKEVSGTERKLELEKPSGRGRDRTQKRNEGRR